MLFLSQEQTSSQSFSNLGIPNASKAAAVGIRTHSENKSADNGPDFKLHG